MKQNMMKNMMDNEENYDDELYGYVTDITDVNNLELTYFSTTYNYDFDYEFIPEYYDE